MDQFQGAVDAIAFMVAGNECHQAIFKVDISIPPVSYVLEAQTK